MLRHLPAIMLLSLGLVMTGPAKGAQSRSDEPDLTARAEALLDATQAPGVGIAVQAGDEFSVGVAGVRALREDAEIQSRRFVAYRVEHQIHDRHPGGSPGRTGCDQLG